MEPSARRWLPSWWPRPVWRAYPGEVFGLVPGAPKIRRLWGLECGSHTFIGLVVTRLDDTEPFA